MNARKFLYLIFLIVIFFILGIYAYKLANVADTPVPTVSATPTPDTVETFDTSMFDKVSNLEANTTDSLDCQLGNLQVKSGTATSGTICVSLPE